MINEELQKQAEMYMEIEKYKMKQEEKAIKQIQESTKKIKEAEKGKTK
ncbi:hypothetical protein [Paenibacillus eucommiae]|uniref:Uncharacterized protein n=1 Tax=Paenibacillus eucommiae TaxID=1355755 RepID=A0ABS4IPJ0_9BACL|nr:hypothetical protein [Paenibacillus eucommiae]MBP1989080.1 hypothetical protein [Paenibacillus eucommiae]